MLKAEQELLDVVGDKMDVFRSAPFFLELVPKGIDKAQSLRRLLAKINLPHFSFVSMDTFAKP